MTNNESVARLAKFLNSHSVSEGARLAGRDLTARFERVRAASCRQGDSPSAFAHDAYQHAVIMRRPRTAKFWLDCYIYFAD